MSLHSDLASGSHYLSPHKTPSRQTLSSRRSKSSLHGDGATRGTSLAHELAAALMPEPSAGSRLLADEFGIEFDEGAEGIEEDLEPHDAPPEVVVNDALDNSFQQSSGWPSGGDAFADTEISPSGSDVRQALHDPLTMLNKDLETTDLFIANLRRMDTDPSSIPTPLGSSAFEPPLERLASDVIRRINDSAREREGQVRELREFEKEFRRIAGQTGGNDILGDLDELEEVDGFHDEPKEKESKLEGGPGSLPPVEEEEEPIIRRDAGTDWELDPNRVLGDEDGFDYGDSDRPESHSPVKEASSLPPPPLPSIPTPASTVTQLAYMRSVTQSLIQSLTTVVEHTQVTGVATAEAGRKIRALKNKLGGWRAEWESAERSIEKIERWEAAGGMSSSLLDSSSTAESPNGFGNGKGLRMKEIMQEELSAFELVLAEAGRRTQAIMAAS